MRVIVVVVATKQILTANVSIGQHADLGVWIMPNRSGLGYLCMP